ncbi:hypothetical protein KAFR_0H02200 [Kazachstania africana CBS 2517]|uniref:Ribosomal lysine N-methyltransferase 5 n=1 Tax=Kazachstania africana (strain ATCC 22294 / BCRC 22015 / CBS 2517 / CECT 1963 / NBRC 1671 / NRRL Y-8276) TaxID=1071382 RepID=H2AZ73_KAZAF|nr:hypothetical protein KAFR_0H02200 [Kazachstania africana CBS 2517]CCF59629.1 hypothetical protein KAFR_0H02200 [Kazachstania africana CBS 2517]
MVFQLVKLGEDTIFDHVFDRYTELEKNFDNLKQDLGIEDREKRELIIDIDPPEQLKVTTKMKRKRKTKQNGHIAQSSAKLDSYTLNIEQSITSLYSSKDNANSTTGYVVWSTTPFFLKWLLYSSAAEPLRTPMDVSTVEGNTSGTIRVPPLLGSNIGGRDKIGVIEMGTGIAGILPVTLGNYADTYICTDQKGIIPRLKSNIRRNLEQLNRRKCVSHALNIDEVEEYTQQNNVEDRVDGLRLEIAALDWENFDTNVLQAHFEGINTIYILAMDVIYNEYLIDPFLKCLTTIRSHFQKTPAVKIQCLIGIHLRSHDILASFLEQALIKYNLPIHYVADETLDSSRFCIYFI